MVSLQGALQHAVDALGGNGVTVELSIPQQSWRGDFTTNVAMQLGHAPMEMAQRIVAHLPALPGIAEIRAVPPGFINITLSEAGLHQILADALSNMGSAPGDSVARVVSGREADPWRLQRAKVVAEAWGQVEEQMVEGAAVYVSLGDARVAVGAVRIVGAAAEVPRIAWLLDPLQRPLVLNGDSLLRPGPHNPHFAVQYAERRIQQLLASGARRMPTRPADLARLSEPVERDLMRRLGQMDLAIHEAVRHHDPSWLGRYALRLARGFHAWFDRSPILALDADLAAARLALADGVGQVLRRVQARLGA